MTLAPHERRELLDFADRLDAENRAYMNLAEPAMFGGNAKRPDLQKERLAELIRKAVNQFESQ